MRVLLVTSWGTACGIAEHSAMLKEAVEAADPEISIHADGAALDPRWLHATRIPDRQWDLIHLNYQAALHSRWTPEEISKLSPIPVLVTYHDSGVPNSDQCKAVIAAANAAVVHEPFDDLPAQKTRYWRMGVPGWQWSQEILRLHDERPFLGTIGFPFGWKNYDALCELTAQAGWGLMLIAPGATEDQIQAWERQQPILIVRDDFVPRREAIGLLSGCDATAFPYTCANTGQSGAILMGIAARKPVIALSTCRQFRALASDPLGSMAIRWCDSFEQIEAELLTLPIQRCDPMMVALAEQESWTKLGARYAALYRELAP